MFKIFAWNIKSDHIEIETHDYETLELAKKALNKIRPKYENYLIVQGTHQIQKTWEYLTSLNQCTNFCTPEEV